MLQSEPAERGGVEKVVREDEFSDQLSTIATPFFQLVFGLEAHGDVAWSKPQFHRLVHDCHHLETFLDDYGARSNRTYHDFTELVAGLRGVAQGGYSIAHLAGRLDSYGFRRWPDSELARRTHGRVVSLRQALSGLCRAILTGIQREAVELGLSLPTPAAGKPKLLPVEVRRQLPRNLGVDDPTNERQRIAEVASRFLPAADLLSGIAPEVFEDPARRSAFLDAACREEHARVYQATVHNLQSTYDTYIRNTVLETRDGRLPNLRGHASAALHLLEAVTALIHVKERHESSDRTVSEQAVAKLASCVPPEELDRMILDDLLIGATEVLEGGRPIAEELLGSYTQLGCLEVELSKGVNLHAQAAAQIVGIVQRYGTPVEMEIDGQSCNAGSILELLVAVGAQPGARKFRFRGDERPLQDIQMLFRCAFGEGEDGLPERLRYLKAGRE